MGSMETGSILPVSVIISECTLCGLSFSVIRIAYFGVSPRKTVRIRIYRRSWLLFFISNRVLGNAGFIPELNRAAAELLVLSRYEIILVVSMMWLWRKGYYRLLSLIIALFSGALVVLL